MAKVEFIEGIQCKQCGHMVGDMNIYTSELCQQCGARIMEIDLVDRSVSQGPEGKWVAIKVTNKLFRKIYEFVREL